MNITTKHNTMKTKTLILAIIIFITLNTTAQTPEIISQANYGGIWSEAVKDIKETADSGFILTAYTYSEDGDITENKGMTDYWILKLDTSLNIAWQKTPRCRTSPLVWHAHKQKTLNKKQYPLKK